MLTQCRDVGVAPDATILSYKVFSPVGIVDDATLIGAFLDAHDAGVSPDYLRGGHGDQYRFKPTG